jgi:lipopolysaccharide transport system permease protein
MTSSPFPENRRSSVAISADSAASSERPSVVIEPRRGGVAAGLQETWKFRRLIPYFAHRSLQKLYGRTKLGRLWIPLRPALDVGIRALVFGGVLKAPSGGVPYFLFFLVGMAGWQFFNRTLFWLVRSIELNRKLVRKLYFPRLILPIASWTPAWLELGFYVLFAIFAALYYLGHDGSTYLSFGPESLLVPAGLLLLAILGFGMGLWAAVLGARTRDARFTLSYILSIWFFVTPVIYPLTSLPQPFRTLAAINPVTGPVEMIKRGLFDTGSVPLLAVLVSVSVAIVALASGLWFFFRAEGTSLDRL